MDNTYYYRMTYSYHFFIVARTRLLCVLHRRVVSKQPVPLTKLKFELLISNTLPLVEV